MRVVLRPFILGRRKEDVTTELPPKTIIVRSVGLEGYEALPVRIHA